jgi:Na+-driven multidrug efflux pump
MNWMLCVPISLCWFWTEEILLALGQPPRVSQFAGDFVRWQLPGLPFMPVPTPLNIMQRAPSTL